MGPKVNHITEPHKKKHRTSLRIQLKEPRKEIMEPRKECISRNLGNNTNHGTSQRIQITEPRKEYKSRNLVKNNHETSTNFPEQPAAVNLIMY